MSTTCENEDRPTPKKRKKMETVCVICQKKDRDKKVNHLIFLEI